MDHSQVAPPGKPRKAQQCRTQAGFDASRHSLTEMVRERVQGDALREQAQVVGEV